MRTKLSALFMSFALFTCMNLTFSNSAEAVDVEINNQIGKTLYVAVLTHNEQENSWFVRFWYNVQPNSFRTLHFPTHNKGHLWIHAHNAERSWGSQKAWVVTNESHTYKLTNGCPSGTNRRHVAFNSYQVGQNGVVRVNYR